MTNRGRLYIAFVRGRRPDAMRDSDMREESWRGAAAIVIEICRADGDGDAPKPRVEVLPDAVDPGKLGLGLGWLSLGGVAVKLSRRDDGKAFGPELGAELGDDRAFGLTVGTPVRPEKEQHG